MGSCLEDIFQRELKKIYLVTAGFNSSFFCYLFLFGKSFFRFNRVCCFDNSICGSKYAWVYFVRLCFNDGFVRGLINFKEEGKDYSLFQSLNTIFAVVLGMMFLTTIVGAFACIVVKAEISLPEAWSSFINAYNWVCLFVLMFLMYYTINAIKDVVINIFNFGQYVQVYAEKQKMMR